jgi:hypothetical protein
MPLPKDPERSNPDRSNPFDSSDKNRLQLLNLERFLVDRVNPPGGQAL